MATILSPSSNSPHDHDHDQDHDDDHIPTATLALPSIATASASRRLPPPCWSPDETVALIDAYRDKWYSLRRGNLRANHWQEVADDVASRCPASPPKTAVQCRHKMEKLRKRYRAEIQRAAAHGGVRRFTSSWVHFQRMHSMEKGPNPSPPSSDDEEEDDHKNSIKRINDLYNYNNQKGNFGSQGLENNGATSAFRIKIPGRATAGPSGAKVYSKFDEMGGQNPNYPNPRFGHSVAGVNGAASSKVLRDGFVGRGEIGKRVGEISKKNKGDGVGEVVAAIQALGEGFMRVEKVKMDMVRQVEEMRMEMELKRTEMILESQQRIVEAFAKAISERSTKRVKRNSTPPDC
ncbi:UNVERIFIED_CONTAM: Trihelix transcription factor ASIL1 [Sesamum calycinum]|uniref:Trihelix transcription factor ASIL1 n=2 Tax=Sesamum TaxID=4181 RepID=A0AAW2NXG4_9LAMI